MWPDRVSNPGPLTNESGALPYALPGPANVLYTVCFTCNIGIYFLNSTYFNFNPFKSNKFLCFFCC